MRKKLFSDQELQGAFNLAYSLHPNMAVAYSVTLDGIDRFFIQKKSQEARPASKNPFKNKLSDAALLQTSIYLASDKWERDQESGLPKMEPFYEPNINDLIVRYIKFLIWKTMELNSSHVAISLGTLLYTYRPVEITSISPDYFKYDNIRRNKSGMVEAVKERFKQYDIVSDNSSYIYTREPTDLERNLVSDSLSVLSPYVDEHADASVLDIYFGYKSRKSEWERNHALIDSKCAGLERLIREYNENSSMEDEMKLDNPDEKLEIPDFGSSFNSHDDDRFNPPTLRETELISLERSVDTNQRRRARCRPRQLRVRIDGKEQKLAKSTSKAFEPFQVSSNASYIEVFGENSGEELLIAVIPLQRLDFENSKEAEFSIEYSDEAVLSFRISRNTGSENEYSIELRHEDLGEEGSEESYQTIKDDELLNGKDKLEKKQTLLSQSWLHINPLKKLLWFFAGAEIRILEQKFCLTDHTKYSLIGAIMLSSCVITSISAAYALSLALSSPFLGVLFGLFWGITLLNLKRFLIISSYREKKEKRFNILANTVPRIIIAIFLGVIITEPLLLKIFQNEVNAQISLQQQQSLQDVGNQAKGLFSEIEVLRDYNERLQDEVKQKERQRDDLYQAYIREQNGLSGSGISGAGPIARAKFTELKIAERDLAQLRDKNEGQIAKNNERLNVLTVQRDEQITRVTDDVVQNDGFLSQLSALLYLKSTNGIVQVLSLLLLLLVFLIELLPLTVKFLSQKGVYDIVLESTIKDIEERYAKGLPLVSEEEVEETLENVKNILYFRSRSGAS